ncbi:MAG: oligosaccharide flippase family protein [Saprospiraceae bacterium]|nr:oligosaccharide flippase family protein [Saprospiraceae bacterium]
MKDRFLKDLGIYGLTTMMVRLINFILIPVYARVLSQKEYGTMDLVTTITYVTSVFIFLELYQAVARFYAEAEQDQRQQIVSTGLLYYILALVPILFFIGLTRNQLAHWFFGDPALGRLLWLAFAASMALALFNYLQTIQRYALESTAYSIANIICVLSTVLVSIWLVVYKLYGLEGVFIGQIVGALAGLVYATKSNLKALTNKPDFGLLKKMLIFSAPLTVEAVVLYLMNYIDRWLIKDFLGLDAVGIYAVMFRIAAVPMLAMNIVSNSLLPHIYREFKEPGRVRELGRLYLMIWVGGCWMVGVMGLFGTEVIQIMAGSQYIQYSYLFPIVLISGFLLHYSYLFVGLYLGNKTHFSAILYALGLALIFGLNWWLLPIWGIAGAAISSIVTRTSILISQWYFSQHAFYFPIRVGAVLTTALIAFLPLIVIFGLEWSNQGVSLLLRAVFAVALTLVLSVYFKKQILTQDS